MKMEHIFLSKIFFLDIRFTTICASLYYNFILLLWFFRYTRDDLSFAEIGIRTENFYSAAGIFHYGLDKVDYKIYQSDMYILVSK